MPAETLLQAQRPQDGHQERRGLWPESQAAAAALPGVAFRVLPPGPSSVQGASLQLEAGLSSVPNRAHTTKKAPRKCGADFPLALNLCGFSSTQFSYAQKMHFI